MKQAWRRLEQRFAALAQRERNILMFGGVAVVLILGFVLVDSSLARQRTLSKQINQARVDAATSLAQTQGMIRQLAEDPDTRAKARIAELTEQVRALDEQVEGIHRGLVAPERMAEILEEMLARESRVKLVRLKTLPVSDLIEGERSGAGANVYKHGIELTLQGSYLAMLGYLVRLEELPWQMFWSAVQMDANDYPAVRITVTVFTLSLDKNWLVV